jgi:neutral ceramidase
VCVAAACSGGGSKTPDASVVTTEQCDYQPLVQTAHAGATVAAAALQAGAAERVIDVPVGTALGGYTARAGFLGSAGVVDARKIKMPGTFNPSIGVITAPRVKAVALTAGDETVLLIKVDFCWVYEGMLFDLEQRLGPDYAGKIILSASHTHSGWAQYQSHGPLKLGSGEMRQIVYDRIISTIEQTARDALAARKAAKLGVFFDGNFDPTDQINHDRRSENDMLPGGNVKDNHFYMIRIDGTDNTPIAAIPIFGEHGTLNGEDNPFASTDAPGALERVFQEQFDSKVVVMHLQSAGGDNSPSGHGGVDCNVKPGASGDPCFSWATEEGHGRAAAQTLMNAWTQAGTSMKDTLELEMLSKSIETGPDPKTFTIRGGALAYAPFDRSKTPDGKVYDGAGNIISPIDEFNAPVGAGLCESATAMFPAAAIPGDDNLLPYGSCLLLDQAAPILGQIFQVDLKVDETHPVCETTRTTISALRIGDYLIGTMPGEMTVMLATYLRSKSPVAADHTILVSYSQGHMGYLLRPEDWLMGGYEPSVTFWGPLAAEYVGEQLLALMPQAMMPTRVDGSTDSATRVATATVTDSLDKDDPAPMAGTIPSTIPPDVWARTGHPAQAQPAATVARVSGTATFTWIGDDPLVKTPHVELQVETTPGVYAPVARRSGRPVEDQEILLAYTPEPLQRSGPQTHVWVAEWQAVPWLGAPSLDTLDDRGGVPLGNYRFHVDGNGWSVDSDPFQVVAGGLEATATRASSIAVTVSWHAQKGFRLMDMNLPSNQPVPVRSQQVTVALLDASNAQLSSSAQTTDASGAVSVANNASATQVKVTDRFGNSVTTPIH